MRGYLALDRTDIQYTAKECARGMSNPTVRCQEIFKRCAKYLVYRPTCYIVFNCQIVPNDVSSVLGSHMIFSQSSTQVPIALSSGEAEFYAVVQAMSRFSGMRGLAADLGIFNIQKAYIFECDKGLIR